MSFLVIDGNSILSRAFYGIKVLTDKSGFPTNAITGFMNSLLMLKKDVAPDRIAVAFDLKAPTFRHKMYDGYKANRKGMPDELALQLPVVKEILKLLGIKIVECEGYEADDILGTLSRLCSEKGEKCVLYTGDRDSFQLVDDNTTVRLAKTKGDIYYTPEKIKEEYGVTPLQMIEVKSLMGDTSDNIPGVPGIGEKTALALISEFESADGVYENIDSDSIKAGIRNKLISGRELCEISKKLAVICRSAPIDEDLDSYIPGEKDKQGLANILSSHELYSLLKKLEIDAVPVAVEVKAEKPDVKIPKMQPSDIVFVSDGILYAGKTGDVKEFDGDGARNYLASPIAKQTFDVKQLETVFGVKVENVIFDVTLAAYLADPDAASYDADRLCLQYSVVKGNTPEEYSFTSAALAEKLYETLYIREELQLLREVEIPLAHVLVSMEKLGVAVDTEGIERFGEELSVRIDDLTEKIYSLAGERFNIGSPKQLAHILFEKLSLPSAKKTKTGYSTNAEVLEELYDKHPIIPLIMEYRSCTKLKSTYVSGLLDAVCTDGRIHSTFKQTETRTGRISSAEPNIQNIPVRTPLGKEMRRFFVASDGYVLVDADYSQIELRVLAAVSDDPIMKKAFEDNVDIHTVTASQVFGQPVQWVTPDLRSKAKAVNFGIVYGIGAYSLSKDIGTSRIEADRYIKAYLEKYASVSSFMTRTAEQAEKDGYVSTLFGRRRYIRELASKNKVVKALGVRIARNTPIQGTAADIIKTAMIKAYERIAKSGLDARLILQVHDELIVEAAEKDAEAVSVLLKEEMENAVKLSVPLTVDVKTGKTWYDTH